MWPLGVVEEVPPFRRRVLGGASIRRYVSLREPHPRLCTFASPRRVPSGHGVKNHAWGPPSAGISGHGTYYRLIFFFYGNRRMRPLRGRERMWAGRVPGVCDPGLYDGYAPLLRIPQICCTPRGAEDKRFNP